MLVRVLPASSAMNAVSVHRRCYSS